MSELKARLVYGVGLNDSSRKVGFCPYYKRWTKMLQRCYSESRINCYKDAKVCSEWLIFSNFKSWMENQEWEGNELDKDLLGKGDKTYSPDNCIFIPKKINLLITDQKKLRGKYAKGVYFKKANQKFVAQCAVDGKEKHVGYYDTEEDAHKAYKDFKYKVIRGVAESQSEPLRSALLNYNIDY